VIPRLTRPLQGIGFASLAWLPAAFVLLVPIWLVIRASEGEGVWARLADDRVLALLGRSVGLALAVAAASVALAVPLAFLTARTDLPGRRWWAVLLALPLAMPSYVGAFALVGAAGRGGMLSTMLGGAAVPEVYGFWGAFLSLTLLGYPYVLLPVRAAFLEVDPRLVESARVLGEGALGAFWRVTVPLVAPAIGSGALMVVLYSLSDFGAVSILQFDTFTRVIFVQHDAFDRGGAAALSLVLLALTATVLVVESAARRRRAGYASRRGARATDAKPVSLGAWRAPAFLACAVVAAGSLLVPVGIVLGWASRGGNVCTFCTPIDELAASSLLVAASTAAVCMILVLPVARAAARGRSLLLRLPDRVIYAGFAIPGTVVALALVFAGTRWVPAIYQTVPALVLACVLRFLPQAADPLRPAMARVPVHVEEAARTLGAGPLGGFVRVTLPLVAGSWLAGGALVFLTTVKELPATLVMRPAGFDTLATELWDLTNEGYLGEAAWRALALLALGVVPMLVLVAWTERRRR
jgi:iron(III) transport system permease protein